MPSMQHQASSPDMIFLADANLSSHDEDLSALLDWSSFEAEATQQEHGKLFDTKPAASMWPSSRISSNSSACDNHHHHHTSPTAETKAVHAAKAMQSPSPSTRDTLEAWSKVAAKTQDEVPAWAGPVHYNSGLTQDFINAPPPPLLVSQESTVVSQCSSQMSWSLARGLSQANTPRPARSGEGQHMLPAPPVPHQLSHQLSAQLSGIYQQVVVQQSAALPARASGVFAGGGKSPFSAHLLHPQPTGHALALPASSGCMYDQQLYIPAVTQQQHQQLQRAPVAMSPTEMLKQLTEDELRRNVQRQVATLVQNETDRAQLSWLHELLELTKTAALPLLGTLRQQLDVLLHPMPQLAPLQQQQGVEQYFVPTSMPTTSVGSDGWNAILSGITCPSVTLPTTQPGLMKASPSSLQLLQTGPVCASASLALQRALAGAGGTPKATSVGLAASDVFSNSCPSQRHKRTLSAAGFDAYANCDSAMLAASRGGANHPAQTNGSEGEASAKLQIKAEPMESGLFEHRWRRRQNNFVMTIDDIVKKVRCQGVRPPVAAAPVQQLPLATDLIDAGGRHINAELVRQVFDKPLKAAADLLSVSVMSLKRTCRKMGVSRWPYRKLASLRELSTTVRDDDLEQQLQPGDKEAVMQYIEAEIAAILQEPDREFDPLLADLRKAKIHMKYEKWGRKAYGCARPASSLALGSVAAAGDVDDDMM